MTIPLATMTRRTIATRRPVIILPVIEPTRALQGELAGIYMRVVNEWRRQAREVILPAYSATMAELKPGFGDAMTMSDDLSDIRNASDGAGEAANRLLLLLTPFLRSWAVRFERWHRLKWTRNVLAPTGVDLSTLIGPEEARETLEAVLARNIALIRSVSDQTRARIADIVFRGFQQRTETRDIAREIAGAADMSRRRALGIASDQTTKLAAHLDTERMLQVGIETWKWRHSGKVHYRPTHRARNGNIYTFTNAPSDMPGMLPWCGCKKQAILTLGGEDI